MPKKKAETQAIVFIVPGEKRLIKAFAELGFDYETEPMDVCDASSVGHIKYFE